jgi:ubiquinone/menaquinone biosynthesis C-methylase UbiE
VLELGAGTGSNLGHYPAAVERLVVSEPDPPMRARLGEAAARQAPPFPVEVSAASAGHLPFADASFDAVVATLVLCSVPDPAAALTEVRRVLRPDGMFVFIEHVAATDRPSRLRWQQRFEPVWKRVAGGCHLTRDTEQLIRESGFTFDQLERASMRKAMPLVRPSIRGVARLA